MSQPEPSFRSRETAPAGPGNLAAAQAFLMNGIGRSDDFRLRAFRVGGSKGRAAFLAYLSGMIDDKIVDAHILEPLMRHGQPAAAADRDGARVVAESLATRADVALKRTFQAALGAILDGHVALFLEGSDRLLVLGDPRLPHRSIGKPETEHSVRGSREGFSEVLGVNIALLRRRLRHPNLRIRVLRVGEWSRTKVAVVHLHGLTNPQIIRTVMARIKALQVDQLAESHTLESFLRDNPYSPFPTVRNTERPDEAVRQLLSGKVLIMTDNTPFVLAVPTALIDSYQTMEDYVFGYWGATLARVIRFIGWWMALFLPPLYIALIAVNPEMVPNELAIRVAGAREGLPFPPIVEVLIIEILVELIREAALRLPQPLGTTIGVVGGIVVGEAIVAAGLISPLMIIFAAVTMLASFTSPTLEIGFPWRLLKWLLILLANMFGLLGVIVGTAVILGHLCTLSSFGVPYLSPFSPLRARDLGDTLVRAPLFTFRRRPAHLRPLTTAKLTPYRQPAEHPDLYAGQRRDKERD